MAGLLEKFKELTVKETAARVSALMPSINENSPASSQQGILNKAVKNLICPFPLPEIHRFVFFHCL